MEKIKVNMSPNPLDVQTIHASQNDDEARQWGFELHNNGELIDTSGITEQLFFKAYKGGTEQLLPENTSTPTTSPFNGDIKYPQGLLADQEFTYRQSPTEEDGNAKIKNLYGNTLVWNQLSKANTEVRTSSGMTLQVVNGLLTISGTPTANFIQVRMSFGTDTVPQGHKVLLKGRSANFYFRIQGNTSATTINDNVIFTTGSGIYSDIVLMGNDLDTSLTYNESFYPQIFDLSQMGLDITSPSEFTSLFPLSYYSYNQGSLLSFNGNGIKTVGKNQIKLSADTLISSQRIGINYSDNGAVFTANGTYSRAGYVCKTIKGQQYTLSFKGFSDANFRAIYISNDLDWNAQYGRINLSETETNNSLTFTATDELFFIGFYLTNTGTTGSMTIKDIQLELGSSVTSYVPYTSSTLSLPISTYFPTGMKSAGAVYDELTPVKATTRIGAVDLGTLDYIYQPQNTRFYTQGLANVIKKQGQYDLPNIIVPNYTVRYVSQISAENNMSVGVSHTSGAVFFSNANYDSVTDFKAAMSGVYLYYELATPTETPITTASLVTENAEIPLSNNDGTLIGKCTEELSAEPGFHDAKIKLSDSDGECYSNKIQLHVERSPQ